jgi:hypothetical protein
MDSEQPVHSALCSQTTEGRLGEVNARAILLANDASIPMTAAMVEQNFMKSRRETPLFSSRSSAPGLPKPTENFITHLHQCMNKKDSRQFLSICHVHKQSEARKINFPLLYHG